MDIEPSTLTPKAVSIDIELTNACNAKCSFCPRDNMPAIGTMKPDIFYKAVERGLELPTNTTFGFCGTGDSMLNKHLVEYTRHLSSCGKDVQLATNGYLLDEAKAEKLLDAGIKQVTFSIASMGEIYDKVYDLDFETTHSNILRFIEMAKGICDVRVAIVHHDEDEPYEEYAKYWRSVGVNMIRNYDLINRGGALFTTESLSDEAVAKAREDLEEQGKFPVCFTPFLTVFIGWDGNYYLCCSDWKKEVPVGHVSTHSIQETYAKRVEAVHSRKPICETCTLDPINQMALEPVRFLDEIPAEAVYGRA